MREKENFKMKTFFIILMLLVTSLFSQLKLNRWGQMDTIVHRSDSINSQMVITQGDDYGIEFQNQVSVLGEFIAGEDSYPVPVAFLCNEVNTTGRTITGCTDVTEILQSDAGSVSPLFGGTTAGSYIIVGSPTQFWGTRLKYNTLGDVNPDSVAILYDRSAAEGWQPTAMMVTNSNYPHEQVAHQISTFPVEQVFYGFNPLEADAVWQTTTQNINGTDYSNLYWGKKLLIGTIVTDPIVQQVKLHSNRIEIENTGIFKYGKARIPYTVMTGVENSIHNVLSNPANEAVNYTAVSRAAYTDNEFANGADDSFIYVVVLEEGMDTSIPLMVGIAFYVKGSSTGDIEFYVQSTQVSPISNTDGGTFIYDGNAPFEQTDIIVPVTVPSNLERQTFTVLVPIYKLFGNSGVVLNIGRDASGGNLDDTVTDNVVVTNVVITPHKWKL